MNPREQMVMLVGARARDRLEELAGEFARAASEEKEAILAGLEFERWLAEACEEATEASPRP